MVRKIIKNHNFDSVSAPDVKDKYQKSAQKMFAHLRRKENRCVTCYDELTKSSDNGCTVCISGYLRSKNYLFKINGYTQIAEFPANDGAAVLKYKVGGEQNKIALYIYLPYDDAKFLQSNDHILIKSGRLIEELVIFNYIPLPVTTPAQAAVRLECTSSTDKRMAEAIFNYDRAL